MKIGVFDSGIGGITVLNELKKRLSGVRFVYLGDTAHVPYGTKSPAQIIRLSTQCAEKLKSLKIDALVVACNTATSLALEEIQSVLAPVPVFGVVQPGVDAALQVLQNSDVDMPILVLCTRATVNSKAYSRVFLETAQRLQLSRSLQIFEQSCPLLVPLIEEGWMDHSILRQTVREYVKPYHFYSRGVALLGCTHYPWIQQVFSEELPGWVVVNSASSIADALEKSFAAHLRTAEKSETHWIFTDPEAIPFFIRQEMEHCGEVSTLQPDALAPLVVS